MATIKSMFVAWLSFLRFALPGIGAALAAEEKEIVYERKADIVLMWAERAGLAVMLVSVAVILYVLVMRRKRLMEGQSKWLLFIGLCVLPVPVAFLSSGVGMEESKTVGFCASCHRPMGPFVEDMKKSTSENLAAIHYKNMLIQENQCWTCHSDYGIAGTMAAKLTGLLHITYVALGKWEAPIQLYRPYNWTICLGCHANAQSFKKPAAAETAHEGVVEAVLEGSSACTDCHQLAHPKREDRTSK